MDGFKIVAVCISSKFLATLAASSLSSKLAIRQKGKAEQLAFKLVHAFKHSQVLWTGEQIGTSGKRAGLLLPLVLIRSPIEPTTRMMLPEVDCISLPNHVGAVVSHIDRLGSALHFS